MGAARASGPKVWKTLMSIDAQQEQDAKVREDLNMPRGGCDACEGQALALRAPRRFFVVRGPVPRNRSLILQILAILAILLQTECMRGTGPRATVKEARRPGHRSAGACPPQSHPHPVHPDKSCSSCFRRDKH